ncbi:MAG: hypothetical protein K2Y01_09395 [Rhabdochlamydiaceae bacterium]|nr:hypothetical protein [Rhabdochlamydiaceae bacterium]
MKFQQWTFLQKHIGSSSSLKQCPRSYLVIHSQREERRSYLEKLGHEILLHHPKASLVFFESEQTSWGQIYETLMTPSLFGEQEIIVWDGLKNLPEQVLEKMLKYISSPSSRSFLLLGAETSKGFTEFYQKAKQELVLLDFSEEKPWDKQKRVQQELIQKAQKEGKRLSPNAVTYLCELCSFDPLLLDQEFLKVATFVGDRKEIEQQDVEKICSSSSAATGWQIAEGLVWGKALFVSPSLVDLSFLLALLGQVRFYLQQGRQLGWCLEQKKTAEEISKILPQLRSTQMQKLTTSLKTRKMPYFNEALDILYEVEMLAKNSNLSPVALLDLLQMRLTHVKQIYTR